ncbi:WSC domain-containing protein [Xylariaceae sp. FL1019]|nr:WSC domain-containing protein [Xylariaceae sp. FL1019]
MQHLALVSIFLLPILIFSQSLSIVNSSDAYAYIGCYNETTTLPNTNGLRALSGGITEALPDTMTVSRCLDFCQHNDTTHGAYQLAGLEYSRECWCADRLDSLSVKLDDGDCNTPCDGENTTACGGPLRLSLYNITTQGEKSDAVPGRGDMWGAIGIGGSVVLLSVVLEAL